MWNKILLVILIVILTLNLTISGWPYLIKKIECDLQIEQLRGQVTELQKRLDLLPSPILNSSPAPLNPDSSVKSKNIFPWDKL
jgi:hypothetical protein